MEDKIITTTQTPKTSAECEAAVNALLAEMTRMDEQSKQTWAEIEQLKAETNLIKERTDILKSHTQAQLGELLARFGQCGSNF